MNMSASKFFFKGYDIKGNYSLHDPLFNVFLSQTERCRVAAADLGVEIPSKGDGIKLARNICIAVGKETRRLPGGYAMYEAQSSLYKYEFFIPLDGSGLGVTRIISNARPLLEQFCRDLRIPFEREETDTDIAKKICETGFSNFSHHIRSGNITELMRNIAVQAGIEIPPKANAAKLYSLLKPVMTLTGTYCGNEYIFVKYDEEGLGCFIGSVKKYDDNTFRVEIHCLTSMK